MSMNTKKYHITSKGNNAHITNKGRPTLAMVKYQQAVHKYHLNEINPWVINEISQRKSITDDKQLLKDCHAKVISLTGKLMLQSNMLQRLNLENRILRRDLDLLSRV